MAGQLVEDMFARYLGTGFLPDPTAFVKLLEFVERSTPPQPLEQLAPIETPAAAEITADDVSSERTADSNLFEAPPVQEAEAEAPTLAPVVTKSGRKFILPPSTPPEKRRRPDFHAGYVERYGALKSTDPGYREPRDEQYGSNLIPRKG